MGTSMKTFYMEHEMLASFTMVNALPHHPL
jgi:hypothetical protein